MKIISRETVKIEKIYEANDKRRFLSKEACESYEKDLNNTGEGFVEELRAIIGNKSLRQFAQKVNISASSLTRLLKKQYRPRPEMIEKIASIQDDNFNTYYNLMYLAGYVSKRGIEIASMTKEIKLKDLKDVLYSTTGNIQRAVVWDMTNNKDIMDGCSIDYAVKEYGEYPLRHIEATDNKIVLSIIM